MTWASLIAARPSAIAALVTSALGSDVAVLVGIDPEQLDGDQYPEFCCIVLENSEMSPNQLLNATAQEGDWDWSLYVGVGYGGTQEDAWDVIAPKLTALVTGLLGQRPDADCTELELRTFAQFFAWRPGGAGVIYRQSWTHQTFATIS